MKKGEKAGEIMAGRKREISQVADDQNWRSYINNELKCAEIWNQDWGFLAAQEGILVLELIISYRQLQSDQDKG